MFIVQSENSPTAIQSALFDLMRNGVKSMRVCCAYMSLSGAEILYDGLNRSASAEGADKIEKIIVTSLDFGLTEPEALRFWMDRNSRVLVVGSDVLNEERLIPRTAFHPKFYLFEKPDGSIGSLIGSANLTNRGLTINTEVAWLEMKLPIPEAANAAWARATADAEVLTEEILERYAELRAREPASVDDRKELMPVPEPRTGALQQYSDFPDAEINPIAYTQMWVQSRGMQGGAGTQLELPRGSHRFFGANYTNYDFDRVRHIAEPILVSGQRVWRDRPLTWHGDNAMERINLPSASMGGYSYTNSLILFRRIRTNTFELRVYPWDSDSSRALVEASRKANLLFRVGRNSNRLVGFLM